jgi:Fe-S-cluster containining protein
MSGREGREKQIRDLQASLRAAQGISPETLAARISDIGFKCLGCGQCCRGQDNSVVVFPIEIRAIQAAMGLPWLDVVSPPEEGEWDRKGCFHTLEWRLKKEGGSCRFYQNGRCSVYRARPMLCTTYPFYLDNCVLMCSECRGLGGRIESCESDKMAELLILRYLFEIQEAIALLERYQDFERGEAKKGGGCIVHDSEGEHRIVGEELFGWDHRL